MAFVPDSSQFVLFFYFATFVQHKEDHTNLFYESEMNQHPIKCS